MSAKLHGAALAIITPHRRRSYFAFTSSGRVQIIRIGVGARERRRDLVRVDEAQPVLRVELALHDDGLAERLRDAHEAAGPRVVQRPGGDVDVVGRVADELRAAPRPAPGRRRRGGTRPSACRSCPTCRSSSRPARRRRAAPARSVGAAADQRVDRRSCRRAASTVEHEDVLDLRDLRADRARTSARTRRRRRRSSRRSGR